MASTLRSDHIGWEEIYGPDQTLEPGDVPVLDNGLVRLEFEPDLGVFSVQRSVVALDGWGEIGRLSFYDDTLTVFHGLISANVVEWTPDRAVLRVVMGMAIKPDRRAEIFITLGRGWTGPKIDMYVTEPLFTSIGAAMYLSPVQGNPHVTALIQGFPVISHDAWSSTSALFNGAGQPYIALQVDDSTRQWFGFIPDSTGMRYALGGDPYSYSNVDGVARRAIGVRTTLADPLADRGMVSARIVTGVRGLNAEAETYRNAAATQQADGAAVSGQAVQVTGAYPTAMVDIPIKAAVGSQAAIGPGRYFTIVRARVITGGQVGQIAARGNVTNVATTPHPFSNTTFGYAMIGEVQTTDADSTIVIQGGGAAGGLRVDRVILIPARRSETYMGAAPDREGVMDQVDEAFMEQGHQPVLLPR